MSAIKKAGHQIVFVTLHVNLGTFAPLTPEAVETGRLHEEHYHISSATAAAIKLARKHGRAIIPVGTTALRAIESAAGSRGRLNGSTSIFIRPGYRFRVADGLITNFHVPKSSLMMLVSALVGRKRLLEIYKTAVQYGYKLFSFGDGMLILPRAAKK
jgi:S-adenosylmethionine:tRNA ribosyltransferase-isomerase